LRTNTIPKANARPWSNKEKHRVAFRFEPSCPNTRQPTFSRRDDCSANSSS